VLSSANLIAFVPTVGLPRAVAFYRDILSLTPEAETANAAVFRVGRTMLRISVVPEFVPAPFTVLGWEVPDIAITVDSLLDRGVSFTRYDGLDQDELGIWTAPGGDRVAWFTDPDGNVLSLTQFADGPGHDPG
jgi:catechol 2,3-dioxygenase-like lactoylglutathione lyase family enzyme